jgi:transcriptional regulator with XRE-family HTH domain
MTPLRLRLRDLRAAKGLTQEQLATVAQGRQETISAMENGETDGAKFSVLERLSKALGCDPRELFEAAASTKVSRKRGK